MSNEVFPSLPGLSWGAKRTIIFGTDVHRAKSGAEVRWKNFSAPFWRFEMDFEYLSGRQFAGVSHVEQIEGLFLRHYAQYDTFLFEYARDKSVVGQVFGVGDGVTKTFQLVRTYGGFTEPVCHLNGAPVIKVGAAVSTAYTVAKGLVTFATAPAKGVQLSWSGAYFYRARFADDEREMEDVLHQIHATQSVVLRADLGDRL